MDATLPENAQNIKKQLETLIVLQQIDDEINKRKSQIKKLQEKIRSEHEIIGQLRGLIARHKQEMDDLLKNRRAAEMTSKQKLEEAQKLGAQLFEVKTNEAYSALRSEIQQRKQENSLLEERILEIMMAEDEVKGKLTETEKELKKGEQQVASIQTECEKEIAILDKEIAEYQDQWQTSSQKVNPDYLDLYQRLLKAKNGKALARIENDICTGCRLSIRAQATIELKKYRGLLYCDNCARILYVD